MRGRPKPELMVSVEDREALERWARRPKTSQALALRSRIVLRCSVQPENGIVASELGVTRQTVGCWRNRFIARGLDGLLDEPRPGAPRKIGDEEIERVITRQLRRGTHRSTVALEEAIRVHLETHNQGPRPFVWARTADEIFESIRRFCLRTSGSGH